MPGFDRTGPEGEGPKTGRGMGKCRKSKKDAEAGEFRLRRFERRRSGRKKGFWGNFRHLTDSGS